MEDLPKKILIVDDNIISLTLFNSILGGLYKVYPVDSCAAALDFLSKDRPDLIMLDLEMPEMSGDHLLHILKSDPKLSGIPVIIATSHENIKIEALAFKTGASDFLRKPIIDTIVLARVRMQLELDEYRKADKNRQDT